MMTGSLQTIGGRGRIWIMTGEYTTKGNTCLRRFMGRQDEEST